MCIRDRKGLDKLFPAPLGTGDDLIELSIEFPRGRGTAPVVQDIGVHHCNLFGCPDAVQYDFICPSVEHPRRFAVHAGDSDVIGPQPFLGMG